MSEWVENGFSRFLSLETLLRGGRLVLTIVVVVILARLAMGLLSRVIDRVFAATNGRTRFARLDEKHALTVASLIKSITHYTVYFIAGVMILDVFGIDTSSLLAAAGIAGLAIGFGAQNLVRDVVSGFFILFEGQFKVGDYITTAGVSGIVEHTGLRTTWVRSFDGAVHIIPNGEMRQVTNHMGPAMRVMFQVAIPYEADVDKAIAALEEGFTALQASGELPDLLEGPKVLGVQELSERGVELLIWAQAKTMTQWAMTRELRKRVKMILDAHGIPVAFPRRMVVFNQPPATATPAAPAAGSPAVPPPAPGGMQPGGAYAGVPLRLWQVPPGALSAAEEATVEDPGPGPAMGPGARGAARQTQGPKDQPPSGAGSGSTR